MRRLAAVRYSTGPLGEHHAHVGMHAAVGKVVKSTGRWNVNILTSIICWAPTAGGGSHGKSAPVAASALDPQVGRP
jgi:hypothetical protein